MNNHQIISLYEQGLEIETIAQLAQLEVETIKLLLISESSKYRKEVKEGKASFGDEDMEAAVSTMSSIMKHAENEGVRFRAAKFIYNEKLGRNNLNDLKNLNVNVNMINIQMEKAKEALRRGKEKIIEAA